MLKGTFAVHLLFITAMGSELIPVKNEFITENMIEVAMGIKEKNRIKVFISYERFELS
jgi:hypothetical protein